MENEEEIVAPTNDTEAPAEAEPTFTEAEVKAYARAKTAEAKAKELKIQLKALQDEKEKREQKINSPIDRDELVLLAKGLSEAEIDEAKSIAKGKDISLTEAVKTKSFTLFQEDIKETERKERAKLGATKGSSQTEEQSFKSGMSTQEHKEAWKKAMG